MLSISGVVYLAPCSIHFLLLLVIFLCQMIKKGQAFCQSLDSDALKTLSQRTIDFKFYILEFHLYSTLYPLLYSLMNSSVFNSFVRPTAAPVLPHGCRRVAGVVHRPVELLPGAIPAGGSEGGTPGG